MKRAITTKVRVVSTLLRMSVKKIYPVALIPLVAVAANAATVTVTVNDDGVSNIGAQGIFYWAITNAHAGDTIAFNIPGSGVHYLLEPSGGFPLVYKSNGVKA